MVSQLPSAHDLAIVKDVLKNMLETQMANCPRDCLKFANVVNTLLAHRA